MQNVSHGRTAVPLPKPRKQLEVDRDEAREIARKWQGEAKRLERIVQGQELIVAGYRRRIGWVREALEPFGQAAIQAEGVLQSKYGLAEIPPSLPISIRVTVADLRHARSILVDTDQPQTPQPVLPTSDDPSTPFAG